MSAKGSKDPLKTPKDPLKGSKGSEKTPFFDEFNVIGSLIDGLEVKYLAKESEIISFWLKGRETIEKDSYRVTSIINYDFFPTLYAKGSSKESKGYLKTYLHDRLLDVTANYYEKQGYRVYKERFLYTVWSKKQIKGHADLILTDKILVEVKNYTEGHITQDNLLRFIHQVMLYCHILAIETAILVINNPKQFKKVCVFKVELGNCDDYRSVFIRELMLIPEYLEKFKYQKPIN